MPLFHFKNIFLVAAELKRGKEEIELFSERLIGWCGDSKNNEKPVFYRVQNGGMVDFTPPMLLAKLHLCTSYFCSIL